MTLVAVIKVILKEHRLHHATVKSSFSIAMYQEPPEPLIEMQGGGKN
ncbi:hypothetical protein [Pseudomonas sp. MF6776]|nr:hypothetical protein [Pseudomonas sp. MF6776]MBK3468778.1 hypothetical protein [Pseudomonas sp. MF6776]